MIAPPHRISSDVIAPIASYTVFGTSTNTVENGGASVQYAYGASLSFSNSLDAVRLISPAGYVSSESPCNASVGLWQQTHHVELQRAFYSTPSVSGRNGRSRELRNPGVENRNVDPSNWDVSSVTAVYGVGGTGTPGAQNSAFVP